MPDYIQKLAALQAEREKTAESNQPPKVSADPAENINTMFQEMTNPKPVDPMAKKYDTSYSDLSAMGNDQQVAERMKAEDEMGAGYMDYRDTYADPESWSPDAINANFIEQSGKSLMFGVGKTIGSFGDAAQYLGSFIPGIDLREGNVISRLLQDVGGEIKDNYQRYIPEEMLSPEFKWTTFTNPDFWSIHIAEAIPQIVELLALKGAGQAGRKGIENVSKRLLKDTLEEGAEATAKLGLRGTTQGVFAGARGLQEVGKGRGLWGKILTDKGTLTRNFGALTETGISGGLMNLRVSMANAGEMYNTYKDIKDPDGNPMFSEQELGQMASQAFTNNLQYFAVDMLSWGMTFGGGWEKLGSLASKGTKFLSPAMQQKVVGGMFTKQVSPLYKNLAKWGGKAGAEGIEETVQESFEEWAKFKAYKDVTGSWKGYQGVTQDYDGFWDYYQSKDSEAIRAISFGAGATIGGMFNYKQLVNNAADESVKMMNRQEVLKQIAQNKESRAWQDHHIRSQMAELVFEGKESYFQSFVDNLAENEIIDEQQLDNYSNMFKEMIAVKEDIADLNISGKKALMVNIANQMDIENKIELENQKSQKIQDVLTNQLKGDPDKLKEEVDKEIKRRDKQLMYLAKILNDFNENKTNLITGKKGKKVGFKTVVDENGVEVIIPDDTVDNTDDNSDKPTEATKAPEFSLRNLGNKAKELFYSIVGKDTETEKKDTENGDIVTEEENNIPEVKKITKDEIVEASKEAEKLGAIVDEQYKDEIEEMSSSNMTAEEIYQKLLKDNSGDQNLQRINELLSQLNQYAEQKEVTNNDSQTELDDNTFNEFVNTGSVPSGVINSIADKISKNETLSSQEIDVRNAFSSEVETMLQEKAKLEEEILDDDITEEEKNYLKKVAQNDSKPSKTLSEIEQEKEEVFKNEKITRQSSSKNNIFDESSDESNDDSGRKKVTVKDVEKKALNLVSKVKSFFQAAKRDLSDLKTNIDAQINYGSQADMDSIILGQQVAVNEKLAEMFPDTTTYALAVNNLSKVLGFPAIGYTISGAIFVDKTKWNQDNVFMHEMSHIYYQLFENEPETQAFLNYLLKNNALVDRVLKDYEDEILYEDSKGNLYKKGNLMATPSFKSMVTNEGLPMTKEQKFESLEKEAGLKLIPIERQNVIKEEVFANGLEGTLAEKYTKYFDQKDETVRQFYAKKWWGKIKDKAEKVFSKGDKDFLQILNPDQVVEYTNKKDFIVSQFKQSIRGKEITGPGRSKLEEKTNAQITAELTEIDKKLNLENELYLGVKVKDAQKVLDESNEVNNLIETIEQDPENWFEHDRLKYGEKASQIIRDFSKLYEKNLRRKFYAANKSKPTNWRNVPIFDKDKLHIKIIEIAQQSNSNIDFIHKIENSEIKELQDFNFYLTEVRPDKNMALSSIYFIYSNQSKLNSVVTKIDTDGNISVENNLNERESSTVDNIIDKLINYASAYFKNKSGNASVNNSHLINYSNLVDAVENIKSGEYTKADLAQVIKTFSNPNVEVNSIVENNIININGKNFTVDTVVNNFIDKVFPTKTNQKGERYVDYSLYNINKQIKPEIRSLVRNIVATNRKFTADFTVYNAVGNQEPVLVINNFITRELKNIENDAMRMNRNDFLKKYSNLSKKNPKGSLSNQMLNYFYDEVSSGNKLDVSLFHGVENNQTKNSNVIRDSNSTEMSVTEFAMYLADLRKNSYMMETGRYSDSPTSYLLKAPKVKIMDLGKFVGGKFTFSNKAKGSFQNIYSAYKEANGDMDIKQFAEYITDEINQEIDFIQKNISSLQNIKNFEPYHTNGVLNNAGKEVISEYVINTIYNGINFSDIFFPSFNSKDLLKRAKSGRSPGFSLGKHVQVEAIPFVDENNDSGAYILPEHAEQIKRAGGNIMPLNNSYKLLHTGVEHNNKSFAGKNIYNKGYFTILDDEAIRISPQLKGLRDLMRKRMNKYENEYGKSSKNILSGVPTQFIYAFPTSSDKSDMLPVRLTNQSGTTAEGMKFTLDNLTNNSAAVEEYLDQWYYDNDDFIGLQGDNFVVQQVMDKQKVTSNTPIQMIRAILTNSNINGNLETAEEIQRLIGAQMSENLEKFTQILESNNPSDIREFLLSNMLLEDVDPTQRFLLQNDKLNITLPALKQIAQNTISNIIRRNGNKYEAPGSVLQAKAPTYQKSYGYTNGTNGLAFYTKNSDGSHNKGEAVLPAYLAGNLKPRKTFLFKENQTTNITDEDYQNAQVDKAKAIAKSEGKNIGFIKDQNGNDIGVYIEGDTFIATRIPAHGPQSTGVFEVVELSGQASNIQLPNEFGMNITGGDFDGDAFFINHKGRGQQHWNKAFDKLVNLWLSKEMANEVVLPIDFEQEAKTAISFVDKFYDNQTIDPMVFSPRGKRNAFNNSLITKNSIGTTANLHSLIGMLAAYEARLISPITINGKTFDRFADNKEESRTINSAKIFNIILDNAKHHFADKLGINEHTDSDAIILRNLGFNLSDIGVILNHPVVKKMNELKSESQNIYGNNYTARDIETIIRTDKTFKIGYSKSKAINIDFKNINTPENNLAVLNLMNNLGVINSEIMKVSGLMQGHNSLEVNPFILEKIITDFNNVVGNIENKGIWVPERFSQNPLVQQYLKTFEFNKKIQSKFDPVYAKRITDTFGAITESMARNLNQYDIKKIYSDFDLFFTSRLLGNNNISEDYYKSLVDLSNEENIFNQLKNEMARLESNVVSENKSNKMLSTTELDNSLLFKKGLRYKLRGNNQFITLNPKFFNNTTNVEERARLMDEFMDLPEKLRNDLMLYDLIKNGWTGKNSLFHIFPTSVKSALSVASNNVVANGAVDTSILFKLKDAIIQQNSNMLLESKEYPFEYNGGEASLSTAFIRNNPAIMRNILKGQETYFKFKNQYKNNQMTIVHFKGWGKEAMAGLNLEDYKAAVPSLAYKKMVTIEIKNTPEKIGIVAIADKNTGDYSNDILEQSKKNETDDGGRSKREIASDYYNYTELLSEEQFSTVNGLNKNVSDVQKKVLYDAYKKDFTQALKESKYINSDTVQTMSSEELVNLYSSPKLKDGEPGYAHRNKFAYARVIRPIIIEIARRSGMEQAEIITKKGHNHTGYEGKDVGFFESYLMANNIPSNQPEIQSLVRQMEVEFIKFKREKNSYMRRLHDVTDALYREQLGYAVSNSGVVDKIKNVFSNLTQNKEKIYKKLYGPLVMFEDVIDDTTGKTITNMKYKPQDVIEDDFKNGLITKAQYDFYNTTTAITEELKPYTLQNGNQGRMDYIPHTAPAWLEIKARRGLLGLAVASKTIDERIYDVKLKIRDPFTGSEVVTNFGNIETMYNNLSKTEQRGFDKAAEFTKIKQRAIALARKGVNEDGSALQISNIEIGSAMGDVFMNRFSKSRSVSSTDLPSWDLNKAFADYTHSTLFNNGNANFSGMNKMLPLVDGILALTDSRKDVNANKYVQKVWKEYFLAGAKQTTFSNNSYLESMGISTDKVIDYLTKGSLIYWLGWKGLAIGGGVYAIGNVLIGKYMNIKNAGTGTWAKGEQRFWSGGEKFNILKPFEGVKKSIEILKNAQFMDINVYDDVALDNKENLGKLFTNIALMPMIWSEKWIQGVDFLGRLTDQEYETLANGGSIDPAKLAEYENSVKNNHGKGYQAVDQRMIQLYSWGRNMIQFSRYIPTVFYDQFAREDINIYGNKHIGSYTVVGKTIQKAIRGEMKPKEFMAYRRNLDTYERKRLDQGLIGFGMLALFAGTSLGGSESNGMFQDANPLMDADKMLSKTTPPSVAMLQNIF